MKHGGMVRLIKDIEFTIDGVKQSPIRRGALCVIWAKSGGDLIVGNGYHRFVVRPGEYELICDLD